MFILAETHNGWPPFDGMNLQRSFLGLIPIAPINLLYWVLSITGASVDLRARALSVR